MDELLTIDERMSHIRGTQGGIHQETIDLKMHRDLQGRTPAYLQCS